MYIVRVVKRRITYYYVPTAQHKRGYRWVEGPAGLRAAQRFRTEEEAAEVTLYHREHYGALAGVISDPLSPPPRRTPRGRYVVRTVGGRRIFYIVLRNGSYRWEQGDAAEADAFRFSTPEAAGRVVAAGYEGTAGGDARIVEIDT